MGPFKVLTISISGFRTLGSSHSWSCLPCCIPACSGDLIPTNTVTLSSSSCSLYTSTAQSDSPSANAALPPHPRLQTSYSSSAHFVFFPSASSSPPHAPGCFSLPPVSSSPSHSLKVVQWNVGGLRVRRTELLHFMSSHPVDLICIQESNLNLSSSFRIPRFSALRSDRTHSRSGIFSTDATRASGGIIIFLRQGLFFSELSTSSLSSLDPYSNYVGFNISLNDSSLLSFLNVYAPPIYSFPRDSRMDSFSPSYLFIVRNLFILGTVTTIIASGTQEVLLTPVGKKYSIGSSLLTFTMVLTCLLFSIAPLALAPPLTSRLLPPLLLLGGTSGPGF